MHDVPSINRGKCWFRVTQGTAAMFQILQTLIFLIFELMIAMVQLSFLRLECVLIVFNYNRCTQQLEMDLALAGRIACALTDN